MGLLSNPHLLIEMYLVEVPPSTGTVIVRLTTSKRPLAPSLMPNAFYEPRIMSISPTRRSCTDPDGNYQIGTYTMEIQDPDGRLGTLLDQNTPTEFWFAREVSGWVISDEGLESGVTPLTMVPTMRGFIKSARRTSKRTAIVEVSDALGSQFSGFNLDKKVLDIPYGDVATVPRDDTRNFRLRIAIGEFSDQGAKDENGVVQPNGIKGIWPLFEIGEIDITTLGPPTKSFADPPVITDSGSVGATGEQLVYYGATIITGYGESTLSNIVGISGAASRNLSNYNWIQGTYDNGGASPFNRVRIWVSNSPDPASFHLWLDEANYFDPPGTFGYADGAAPFQGVGTVTRDELDTPKELTVPVTTQAQTNPNVWSVMEVCKGYSYDILGTFGSDLADGQEPKRHLIPADQHGLYVLTSDDPGWPYPNSYIVGANGVILTGVLARGPILNAHRDGSVTMAVNFCGPHGNNGKVINQMGPAIQFLFNEHCLKNKGTGYRDGTYGTLETYNNGDPVLQTSAFAAAQAQTVGWIGDDGYLAAIYIVDPNMTWRQVVQKLCLSFGIRFAPNRFWQIKPFFVQAEGTLPPGRHFRERIEIKHTDDDVMAYDQILNSIISNYFFDIDTGKFRGNGITFPNLDSIAAHVPGGVPGDNDLRGMTQQTIDRSYVSDAATFNDVNNRELMRRQRRPRYPNIVLPMLGMDHDIGEVGRLTDSHGLGPTGDNETPIVILDHTLDIYAQEVVMVLQDLRSIESGAHISVGDNVGPPITSFAVGDNVGPPITSVEVG